jgi:tetratricopeptide (TPR) repeat protein
MALHKRFQASKRYMFLVGSVGRFCTVLLLRLELFSFALICVAHGSAISAQISQTHPKAAAQEADTTAPLGEFEAIAIPAGNGAFPDIRSLLSRGAWLDAEHRCRQVIAADSSSADAQYLLAYALFRQRKAADSLRAYTAAAALRRPEEPDLMAVAVDYVILGDYSDAGGWFSRATEWAPDDPLAWYYRGRAEYQLDNYPAALASFQKVLRIKPQNVRAEDNLGLTFEMLGDIEKARAAFLSAIQMESDRPSGYSLPLLNMGTLLVGQGDVKGGLPYLQKAVAMSPGNPKAREELARAYQQEGQDAAAERELQAALVDAPDTPALHFLLGRLYQKEGKGKEAAAEFERTAALNKRQSPSEVPDRLSAPPK